MGCHFYVFIESFGISNFFIVKELFKVYGIEGRFLIGNICLEDFKKICSMWEYDQNRGITADLENDFS